MPAPSQHAFSEKVALVVNAASPVGRAVSMQLGLYGSYVIAAYGEISPKEVSAVEELRSLGTLAHSLRADAGTADGAADLIGQVGGIYGRLDLLVNCLDALAPDPFDEASGAGFSEAVSSVLAPAYHVTRSALALMQDRPKASVVNVVRYGSSRSDVIRESVNAAVERLTASFASELPSKFRINAVSVREDRARPGRPAEVLDPELFKPRGAVDPDDAARAVVYLLSSEAKGVNGQVLEIG